jgi:hypothetical protein
MGSLRGERNEACMLRCLIIYTKGKWRGEDDREKRRDFRKKGEGKRNAMSIE